MHTSIFVFLSMRFPPFNMGLSAYFFMLPPTKVCIFRCFPHVHIFCPFIKVCFKLLVNCDIFSHKMHFFSNVYMILYVILGKPGICIDFQCTMCCM